MGILSTAARVSKPVSKVDLTSLKRVSKVTTTTDLSDLKPTTNSGLVEVKAKYDSGLISESEFNTAKYRIENPAPQLVPLPAEVSYGIGTIKPKPLGGVLFRETGEQGLNDLIRSLGANTAEKGSVDSLFVSDSKDLAIGQGGNKGVKIVFDGDLVSGAEFKKPATGIAGVTGKEFKTNYVGRNSILELTVPKEAKLNRQTQDFLNLHYDKKEMKNGLIRYTRAGALASSLVVGSAQAVDFTTLKPVNKEVNFHVLTKVKKVGG